MASSLAKTGVCASLC